MKKKEDTMLSNLGRVGLCAWLFTAAIVLLAAGGVAPAAAESGTLKLMVTDCFTSEQIDNARVEVVIWREGVGKVDTASGYTEDGYIEFTFDDLEDEDKARVSATPSGQGTDSRHTYFWNSGDPPQRGGAWDLTIGLDGICEDVWWDKDEGILGCVYLDPR